MKTLLTCFYVLFFLGFILKLFHIHYNAIAMLVGLGGIVITTLTLMFQKGDKLKAGISLVSWLWLLLLFLSIKFLQFQSAVLGIATFTTLVLFVIVGKENHLLKAIPLGAVMLISLTFYLLPTHERYKVFNINWNHEIESDYITWDKYSWFLYQNGKFEEALQASTKAKGIAVQFYDNKWVKFIEEHSIAIEQKNWEKYR